MRIEPARNVRLPAGLQPKDTTLVGYAALLHALGVRAPMPDPVRTVSDGRIKTPPGSKGGTGYAMRGGCAVYDVRYAVDPTFEGHLLFALRHERMDLLALKRIFAAAGPGPVEDFVRTGPTGPVRRQAWFLYEWLTRSKLDLPDASSGNYVDAIDPQVWHAARPVMSQRHRIRDNLPGTPSFCPLTARDDGRGATTADAVEEKVRSAAGRLSSDLVSRLRRRLLLKDSRSTYLIEQENPSAVQLKRWIDVVAEAGRRPFSVQAMIEIQEALLADNRLVTTGVRKAGVFLGDHVDGFPSPNWIGAKPEDLDDLLSGMEAAGRRMAESEIDPVVHAAALGFGWVFVHPFEDGNGRIHRYILQHVLGERGVEPLGIQLPVAKAIWRDIEGYHRVLRTFDGERMPFITWKPTANGNVDVVNDTRDLYAFFDATRATGFVRSCLDAIVATDIPEEIGEIRNRDKVLGDMRRIVDMPDKMADDFVMFVRQNGGVLSKGRRRKEFAGLDDCQVKDLQEAVAEVYALEIASDPPAP